MTKEKKLILFFRKVRREVANDILKELTESKKIFGGDPYEASQFCGWFGKNDLFDRNLTMFISQGYSKLEKSNPLIMTVEAGREKITEKKYTRKTSRIGLFTQEEFEETHEKFILEEDQRIRKGLKR